MCAKKLERFDIFDHENRKIRLAKNCHLLSYSRKLDRKMKSFSSKEKLSSAIRQRKKKKTDEEQRIHRNPVTKPCSDDWASVDVHLPMDHAYDGTDFINQQFVKIACSRLYENKICWKILFLSCTQLFSSVLDFGGDFQFAWGPSWEK